LDDDRAFVRQLPVAPRDQVVALHGGNTSSGLTHACHFPAVSNGRQVCALICARLL
jgi:hypothetical protein